MEHTIIPQMSVEDLKKHRDSFISYNVGGEHREAFLARQTGNFDAADANKNNLVEKTEFATLIGPILETFNIEPTEANQTEFFGRIDKDGDGKISREEYFLWLDSALTYLTEQINAELAKRGE